MTNVDVVRRLYEAWSARTRSKGSSRMREVGDKVLCYATFAARARAAGVGYEKREPQVWTLRDGKVLRLEWFHDEREALRAAGLSAPG